MNIQEKNLVGAAKRAYKYLAQITTDPWERRVEEQFGIARELKKRIEEAELADIPPCDHESRE
jgi:hypothetical protein